MSLSKVSKVLTLLASGTESGSLREVFSLKEFRSGDLGRG